MGISYGIESLKSSSGAFGHSENGQVKNISKLDGIKNLLMRQDNEYLMLLRNRKINYVTKTLHLYPYENPNTKLIGFKIINSGNDKEEIEHASKNILYDCKRHRLYNNEIIKSIKIISYNSPYTTNLKFGLITTHKHDKTFKHEFIIPYTKSNNITFSLNINSTCYWSSRYSQNNTSHTTSPRTNNISTKNSTVDTINVFWSPNSPRTFLAEDDDLLSNNTNVYNSNAVKVDVLSLQSMNFESSVYINENYNIIDDIFGIKTKSLPATKRETIKNIVHQKNDTTIEDKNGGCSTNSAIQNNNNTSYPNIVELTDDNINIWNDRGYELVFKNNIFLKNIDHSLTNRHCIKTIKNDPNFYLVLSSLLNESKTVINEQINQIEDSRIINNQLIYISDPSIDNMLKEELKNHAYNYIINNNPNTDDSDTIINNNDNSKSMVFIPSPQNTLSITFMLEILSCPYSTIPYTTNSMEEDTTRDYDSDSLIF